MVKQMPFFIFFNHFNLFSLELEQSLQNFTILNSFITIEIHFNFKDNFIILEKFIPKILIYQKIKQ